MTRVIVKGKDLLSLNTEYLHVSPVCSMISLSAYEKADKIYHFASIVGEAFQFRSDNNIPKFFKEF